MTNKKLLVSGLFILSLFVTACNNAAPANLNNAADKSASSSAVSGSLEIKESAKSSATTSGSVTIMPSEEKDNSASTSGSVEIKPAVTTEKKSQ